MPLYQGIRRGLNDAIRGFAGNPYESGRREASGYLRDDAYIRNETAEAEGREFANQARRGLAEQLQSYAGQLPAGVSPDLIAGAVNIAKDPNAGDISTLLTALDDLARKTRAEASTDPMARNALIGIGAGKQIEPYSQSGMGPILNKATGAVDVSNPVTAGSLSLMDATRAKIAAQQGQAAAAAGASGAAAGASNARAGASGAAASLSRAREQDLRENPEGGTGSSAKARALGTLSPAIESLVQKLDENGKPVIDQAKLLDAYQYGEEQGIGPLNERVLGYEARPSEDAKLIEEIRRADALAPPAELPVGPEAPIPGAADIGLDPTRQPDISNGLIQGTETPQAIPINGIPHKVIERLPGGKLRVQDPTTGRTGTYFEGEGDPTEAAADPLSQADPKTSRPRRITGTIGGQPFDFTIA